MINETDKSYKILLQNKMIKIIIAENILIHEVRKKIQDKSNKPVNTSMNKTECPELP